VQLPAAAQVVADCGQLGGAVVGDGFEALGDQRLVELHPDLLGGLGGGPHDHLAAVGWVWCAGEVALLLEAVEHGGDAAGGQPQLLAQLAGQRGRLGEQELQAAQVGGVDPQHAGGGGVEVVDGRLVGLVAADGASSAVRQQYLPNATVTDAGIAIGGKVPITAETKPLLPHNCFQGLSLVFAPKGRFCIWHVMEFKWDTHGQVKGGIGGNDAELIEQWPGLLFDNTRDYINWGFWASSDKYPPGVTDLRGNDLIRLVLDMTPGWHPNLRKLFALTNPGSCFPITIRTSAPIQPWQPSSITLLGDAIHTMTPGQGVGANTALRDAALLCRQLAAAQQGAKPLLAAIGDYQAEMVPYGFARVADSLAQNGSSGNDPLHKPVLGRIMLAATRTYFRAVGHIPAVRRQFLNSLYTYRSSRSLTGKSRLVRAVKPS
jgi:2-polyprenyl-6-methoxyphenol hydroxylase-like FAD-dependent oxidoreductase